MKSKDLKYDIIVFGSASLTSVTVIVLGTRGGHDKIMKKIC